MLVLASASPRRRELLIQAGLEFKVIPSSVPETLHPGEDAICFATRLAREKAQAVFAEQSVLDVPENPLLTRLWWSMEIFSANPPMRQMPPVC